MNKLKKLGVSALAGSLVAVSAQAGELAVSGTWELTYKSDDIAQTGNAFGSKSSIGFNGSGDMNGHTATWFAAINDNSPAGFGSHLITLDMGDMGTVGFDQGVGKFGFGTIDDKSPTAYEESWHNTLNSSGGLGATGGTAGVLGYSNAFAGINLTAEYSPSFTNTTDNGDGGTSGAGSHGSNINFALTSATLVDGLDIGVGAGENSDNRVTDGTSQEQSSIGAYANYSMGPITVGYTQTYSSGATAASSANAVTAYGIAFNINDNLSVSWNQHENEYKKTATAATGAVGQNDVTQESTGIAVAYTMGAASVKIQNNSMDNVTGTSGTNDEITEISLTLAF